MQALSTIDTEVPVATGVEVPVAAMVSVEVSSTCTACGACLATCPTGALLPAPHRPLVVPERCTGCLACIEVCPRDAITETRSKERAP